MGHLDGKVAVVTGGNGGIGLGIAMGLAGAGANIVVAARSVEKTAQALEDIRALGVEAYGITVDVTQEPAIQRMVTDTIDHMGRLDILVNNAGGSSGFAPVSELSDEAWNEALNWMLNATFWATRRALPDMLSRGWGRIINIPSVEGILVNKTNVSHYIVNKSAINASTKVVAFENGPLGLHSNAILPGAVETDLMTVSGAVAAESMGMTYAEYIDTYAQESAIKRINTVEEVAAVAVLLASELGGGITGALMDVHGGTAL